MDKVKDAIIENFENSIEAWRGLATTDNMFLIGRIDAREAAVKFVEYAFRTYGEGEWKKHNGYVECSLCGTLDYNPSNYCGHCGAKMKGVENNVH